MNFIGNFLFKATTITIGICYTLSAPIALISTPLARKITIVWLKSIMISARIFCGIKVKIHNDNFRNETGVIIASNHCSAWETFFISHYYSVPSFILKKSLMRIPFIGIFLKKFNMIGIDRDSLSKKNIIKVIRGANSVLASGKNIVIFPQGTRVPIEESYNYEKYPYKSGVTMFASGQKILTISTDASKCFGKGLFSKKKSGTINIIFNEIIAIDKHEEKDIVATKIRDSIEAGMKKIL